MVSRLMGDKVLTGDPKDLMEVIEAIAAQGGILQVFTLGGKGVMEAGLTGGSDEANLGWRKACVRLRLCVLEQPCVGNERWEKTMME